MVIEKVKKIRTKYWVDNPFITQYSGGSNTEHVRISDGGWRSDFECRSVFEWSAILCSVFEWSVPFEYRTMASLGRFIYIKILLYI